MNRGHYAVFLTFVSYYRKKQVHFLLLRTLNLTRTQASCAGVNSARSSVNERLYLLNIGLEGSVCTSV